MLAFIPSNPFLAMIGTIINAAIGSAHYRPKAAIEEEPDEQDRREIDTEVILPSIGVHCRTTQGIANLLFGA